MRSAQAHAWNTETGDFSTGSAIPSLPSLDIRDLPQRGRAALMLPSLRLELHGSFRQDGEACYGTRSINTDGVLGGLSGIPDVRASRLPATTERIPDIDSPLLESISVSVSADQGGFGWLAVEISYTFVSWMVHECPGYWSLQGGGCTWRDGQVWPEDVILEDFLARTRS